MVYGREISHNRGLLLVYSICDHRGCHTGSLDNYPPKLWVVQSPTAMKYRCHSRPSKPPLQYNTNPNTTLLCQVLSCFLQDYCCKSLLLITPITIHTYYALVVKMRALRHEILRPKSGSPVTDGHDVIYWMPFMAYEAFTIQQCKPLYHTSTSTSTMYQAVSCTATTSTVKRYYFCNRKHHTNHTYLRRHDGSLKVLRPNSGRPVADGHEVLVLRGIALDAVDRPVMLARPHVKDADAVVLLSVTEVHLYTAVPRLISG